jgi:hypothetical protein
MLISVTVSDSHAACRSDYLTRYRGNLENTSIVADFFFFETNREKFRTTPMETAKPESLASGRFTHIEH